MPPRSWSMALRSARGAFVSSSGSPPSARRRRPRRGGSGTVPPGRRCRTTTGSGGSGSGRGAFWGGGSALPCPASLGGSATNSSSGGPARSSRLPGAPAAAARMRARATRDHAAGTSKRPPKGAPGNRIRIAPPSTANRAMESPPYQTPQYHRPIPSDKAMRRRTARCRHQPAPEAPEVGSGRPIGRGAGSPGRRAGCRAAGLPIGRGAGRPGRPISQNRLSRLVRRGYGLVVPDPPAVCGVGSETERGSAVMARLLGHRRFGSVRTSP